MADKSLENDCGCLYFFSSKGLSQPFYLTLGKTTIGSDFQCNIRIKGIENIFCCLDSNEAGFTVLVNSNEDERVLLNGEYAQKYSVLSHDDHFQLGDKKFKYCKPDINEKDLESFSKAVASKMLGNLTKKSKRKSRELYPLKRLQYSSPRRFSTGSRISEIKFLSKVPERNLTLVKTSTPLNDSKTRLSQKITKPRHSALGVLKENETFDFQFNSRKSNSSKKEDLTKLDDSFKAEFKVPTPKKNMLSTGNMKELDLNSTMSSSCSPMPTRKKMYSGNMSDVSDFTTPENNISVANITPLNVSKRKLNINKSLLTSAESSTPKSTVRRQRSSSMYRPIVEEITPVSPLSRSSLRISSLKKPSFTQRRSVNFNISSNSDCSLIHSDLVKNLSFKPGAKRKRCLSDISGSANKKKISERTQESENILDCAVSDSEVEVNELKDNEVSKLEEKETTPEQGRSPPLRTSVGYDSDLEDICISLVYKNTSGRHYIDNSWVATPEQSMSSGRCTGRRTSIHKHRTSNAYSAENELAETSKITVDSSFEAVNDETPFSSGDGESSPRTPRLDKMNSFVTSVGKSSMQKRNNVTLPSSTTKTPKKSIDRKDAKTSSSEKEDSSCEENPGSETTFDNSVVSYKDLPLSSNVSTKEPLSLDGISDKNDYNALSDSLNFNLSASDVSTRSGKLSSNSSRLDKMYSKNLTEKSVIATKLAERTSTPVASNTLRKSRSGNSATSDVPSQNTRSSIRSNLRCLTRSRSSITKTTDKSLLMRQLKRRFSVDQASKSPVVLLRNSLVSTAPSEASICTRATIDSRKSSSESLSENTSSKHTELSFKTTRRSKRNSATNISGALEISSRNSLTASWTPTITPKNTSTKSCKMDKSTPRLSSPTESSKFMILESDESLSGVSLGNTDRSFTNTQKSSAVSTPVSALSKISNSIIYSFVNSSFDSSLQENNAVTRRSSRLIRPSIDESVYEISKLNASSQKSNNCKSVTSNRIREWIQSPAESKSSMEKGDYEVFRASHEKDPTDIKITEATFSKFLESPKKTPKVEKSISTNYALESDPTDITTLRRLLKTPKKSISSKNDITTMNSSGKFRVSARQNNKSAIIHNNSTTNTTLEGSANAEKLVRTQKSPIFSGNETSNTKEEVNFSGPKMQNSPINDHSQISVKRLMVTPKIQNSPKSDSTTISGIKKLLKTSKKQNSPKNDLTNVAGIKKLMATPKEYKSPKNDLTNVAGVERILRTPKVQKSPKNDLTRVAGVKKLMSTPIEQKSPKNDLTNVAGIKRLLQSPRLQKSPKNDLSQVAGIKKLLATPKTQNSPINDLTQIAGVKKLMATPKIQSSPKNDLSRVSGVKKLMATPKIQSSPKNDLSQVSGVKKLMATPKIQSSPRNDLTQIVGVKKLMATPKVQSSPKNDLSQIAGVKKLMATPKIQSSPKNDLTHVEGVDKLMATPAVQNSPLDDLTNVSGIREMLKTPREPRSVKGVKKLLPSNHSSPNNDMTNIVCLKKLVTTPKQQKSPENDLSDARGVKHLLRTPKVKSKSNDSDLFNTNNDFDLSGIDRLFNESIDNTFDKLLDKKPLRTYIKSPNKQNRSNENCIGEESPAVETSSKHSNARNSAGSTRSRNCQKQLYDSVKESISATDVDVNETSTLICSTTQAKTPSRNNALEFITLQASRSKRGQRNHHVPTIELDHSSELAVKVTSTPLSIQYENENNISTQIESNGGRRKADKKRKRVDSDNEKLNKSKMYKSKLTTRDSTNAEINESKTTNTINNISTDDGNRSEEVANSSFKQGPRGVGKSLRSKKTLVNENEEKTPLIEEKTQSKSTRKNVSNIGERSNENLSKNNEFDENKRKRNRKENAKDDRTVVEKSNGMNKDAVKLKLDVTEVTDNSSSINVRTRTRRGHKEFEKVSINETDSQNVSLYSNMTSKRKLRKGKEIIPIAAENVEIEALYTKTRSGKKKVPNYIELNSGTRKGKDETEKNVYIEQSSVATKEKAENSAKEKEVITLADEESNTQKVKKNMKINKISETEVHNISLDINLESRTKTRRVKDIVLDNEKITITNNVCENLPTKTRRAKKEKESENKAADETGTCSVTSESSCKTQRKTKRGKNIVKDYEETSEIDVSCEVVQSKTRRGRKETRKNNIDQTEENDDCLEQNSKTSRFKRTIQAELETSLSDVNAKKMRIRTRGNIRNTKEAQSNSNTTEDISADHNANDNSKTNIENEEIEPGARKMNKSSKKKTVKPEKEDVAIITARNTRSNRGQNRKYDEIEWHTPVKFPCSKIKKNVTFDKKSKSTTTIVNDSPVRMTRSRRAKK